jgi:hypothetical protein
MNHDNGHRFSVIIFDGDDGVNSKRKPPRGAAPIPVSDIHSIAKRFVPMFKRTGTPTAKPQSRGIV